MSLIHMKGVSKWFRRGRERVVAVNGLDLEVAAGEFVGLVGPSGSGKSTLLHLAGGLDRPDEGAVLFDGRDLTTLSVAERARLRRRDVGFVFQFFHLIPTLTVAENVALPLVLDGVRRPGSKAAAALERVGLGHRARHLPGELSGGEMQRTAIARAVVHSPRLILADEPTGNLDSATGADVLAVLADQVSAAGAALVMATHDPGAAARAGRVVRLRDGRLDVSLDGHQPPGRPSSKSSAPVDVD